MQTITQDSVVVAKPVSRIRRRIAVMLFALASVFGFGAANAFALPVDPLSGAGDTFFTTLSGYLTTTLVPAVIGLAVIGIAVSMLIKWGKKGAKSS